MPLSVPQTIVEWSGRRQVAIGVLPVPVPPAAAPPPSPTVSSNSPLSCSSDLFTLGVTTSSSLACYTTHRCNKVFSVTERNRYMGEVSYSCLALRLRSRFSPKLAGGGYER